MINPFKRFRPPPDHPDRRDWNSDERRDRDEWQRRHGPWDERIHGRPPWWRPRPWWRRW